MWARPSQVRTRRGAAGIPPVAAGLPAARARARNTRGSRNRRRTRTGFPHEEKKANEGKRRQTKANEGKRSRKKIFGKKIKTGKNYGCTHLSDNAELASENEALRAIAARQPKGDAAAGDQAGGQQTEQRPQSLSRDDVQQEAARLVAQQNFDKSANDADAAGRTRYKAEWDKATERLKELGGFDGPTMTAILATDDPAQVLYLLGSKPEEYQRIMELPEARRQNELVKLGIPAPVKKNPPSNAALPVDGISTRARPDADALDDKLDDDTWYARRKRQKDARFAARQQNRA